MTLDMESPLFVHTKKLATISPPPQRHNAPQQNPRISFSITEILKPDFGSAGSELRTPSKRDTHLETKLESKLSPVSPPLTPTSPIAFTKDSCTLQSYYQLYQQRYAQYVYQGLQLPNFTKLSPPAVQAPHPYGVLPAPVGVYNPHPHHPHFPAPVQQVIPQHHPIYPPSISPPTPSTPPQPQPTKRPLSPPAQLPRKTPIAPPVKPPPAPVPTSPQPGPKEASTPGQGDEKDGEGNPLWPAWVYCTRYSDRPSAGPRSRKMKRREKASNSCDEKRPRTAFTNEQLDFLRREFEENKYLTEDRRQRLAKQLELTESQIKIWFQNKRAKLKKSSGSKNALTMSLIAQGLYNHAAPSGSEESSQTSDSKLDSS